MRRILGVVLHPSRPVEESLALLRPWTERNDAELVARTVDADRAGCHALADEEFTDQVDAVVSLGGDGTMLGALRLLADRPVPVIGVNHGHLGFLVDIQPGELPDALDRIAVGAFAVENRHALRVQVDGRSAGVAFNDVVVGRSPETSAVGVDLALGAARYGYYRADAVVVATGTGSTAYSYAAGGPVVSPSAPVVLVTPVAPMSGISRPIVLGEDEPVRLTVTGAARLEIDGVPAAGPPGEVLVALQRDAGRVVRLDAERNSARNRVKLSLLDLPLRPDQLLELIPARLREQAEHE